VEIAYYALKVKSRYRFETDSGAKGTHSFLRIYGDIVNEREPAVADRYNLLYDSRLRITLLGEHNGRSFHVCLGVEIIHENGDDRWVRSFC